MTITIARGRQFQAADATSAVFDEKGNAGTWLKAASEKLVAQGVKVQLSERGQAVPLSTPEEWAKFLGAHAGSADAAKGFTEKFGVTFQDFANLIDDAAAADDKDFTLDVSPGSELAAQLSLDSVDGDYGSKLAAGAKVNLTGNSGQPVEVVAKGLYSIGPEVLTGSTGSSWDRDRTEQESWVDFQRGNGASSRFRENTGPAPYAKLTDPKWDDAEAMALVDRFALPLHLETNGTNPDGSIKFQDGSEMFRETYYDDKHGSLGKAGASVRARVRFDDDPPFTVNRVLVQAKEGRELQGDRSAVHKFEKRWEGNSTTEEMAKDALMSGKDRGGKPLEVAAKLYKLAQDKGTLPDDGQLQLEARFTVLQKRRRTHLQLDSLSTVQGRKTALEAEIKKATDAGAPVDPRITAFATKLDAQIKFMTDAGAALQKYGQRLPSGEAFIVSADRFSVYDAAARAGSPPNDIDDEVGRLGQGPLHVEAEWDTASSDPFEKALEEIEKRLTATPAPSEADRATLEADKGAIEGMRETFRADVQTTVDIIRERMQKSGVPEEPTRASKEQRAAEIGNSATRPVFWF